jgi:hypothetical protein
MKVEFEAQLQQILSSALDGSGQLNVQAALCSLCDYVGSKERQPVFSLYCIVREAEWDYRLENRLPTESCTVFRNSLFKAEISFMF